MRRLALAAAGVGCVGLAVVGVVLPGLPTTVFLILASYLFTRSCPVLEEHLVRNRFFSPYLRYMDGSTSMPLRARIITVLVMWAAVASSTVLLAYDVRVHEWVSLVPPAAAVVGTWVILRYGKISIGRPR